MTNTDGSIVHTIKINYNRLRTINDRLYNMNLHVAFFILLCHMIINNNNIITYFIGLWQPIAGLKTYIQVPIAH